MTPQKYLQFFFHTPKNIHFLKTPQNIEIQKFEPQKNDPSLRMYENIRVPPPPHPTPGIKLALDSYLLCIEVCCAYGPYKSQ